MKCATSKRQRANNRVVSLKQLNCVVILVSKCALIHIGGAMAPARKNLFRSPYSLTDATTDAFTCSEKAFRLEELCPRLNKRYQRVDT